MKNKICTELVIPEFFIEPRKKKIKLEEIVDVANYIFKIPKLELIGYFNKLRSNNKNDIVIIFGSFVNSVAYNLNMEASDLDILIIKRLNHNLKRKKYKKFISLIEINKNVYSKPKENWYSFLLMYPHILIKTKENYRKIKNKIEEFFKEEEKINSLLIHLPLYIIRKNVYIKDDKPKEKKLKMELKELEEKDTHLLNPEEIARRDTLRTILFAETLGNKEIIRYLALKGITKEYVLEAIERIMSIRGFKKEYIAKAKKYISKIYPAIY